jgi:hypothetical protein
MWLIEGDVWLLNHAMLVYYTNKRPLSYSDVW